MTTPQRKLLLSLSPELVDQLDHAASVLGMCRSDVIRRSLQRDLGFVMSHELPNMERFQQESAAAHEAGLAASDGGVSFTGETSWSVTLGRSQPTKPEARLRPI